MTGRFSRSHYKTFRQTCTLEAALQDPDSAIAAKAAFAVRRLRRRVSAFINAVAALLDGGAKVVRPAQRWLRLAINGPAENRPYIIPPGPLASHPAHPPAGTRFLCQHHLTADGGVSKSRGLTFRHPAAGRHPGPTSGLCLAPEQLPAGRPNRRQCRQGPPYRSRSRYCIASGSRSAMPSATNARCTTKPTTPSMSNGLR